MGEVRVGTCSWSDKSLLASGWYPADARDATSRLRHYAEHFDTVEVDSTFYAIPSESVMYGWTSRTSPGFVFNIKSFGLFTHHSVALAALPGELGRKNPGAGNKRVRLADLPKSERKDLWDFFYERVMVLQRMRRLGYLLFQFPPGFEYGTSALGYIKRLAELCRPVRAAIEVRHRSWVEKGNIEEFLNVLREENMAFVAVDEPQLLWTVPFEWHITATWGTVLRLHGRNSKAWMKKGVPVSERFAYQYDIAELRPFAGEAAGKSGATERVYVMFNNCFRDFAVMNALQMKALMGLGEKPETGKQEALDLGENL